MKRGFTVLILAVLISGLVFASSYHGSAAISFGLDFDNQAWGFANSTSEKYTFNFEYDTTSVSLGSEHQTEIWAELAATATAYSSASKVSGEGNPSTIFKAYISTANIHVGEDITIGILNAGAPTFYAAYFELNSSGDPANDSITASSADASKVYDGFTVSYNNDELGGTYAAGLGATGVLGDSASAAVFAHLTTPEFSFVDDQVVLAGSVYGVLGSNVDNRLGINAKAGFNAEKFGVILAADTAIKNDTLGADFVYEVALNAKALDGMLTFDAYATPGAFIDGSTRSAYYTDETMALDMKVAGNYTLAIDEISVDLSAYAKVCDTLIDYRAFFIGTTESATVDAFTFELSETIMLQPKTEDITLSVYANVAYDTEKFDAYAEVSSIEFNLTGTDAVVLPLEVGVSTEFIVEGADLSLIYANSDFVAGGKGAVTATCSIGF